MIGSIIGDIVGSKYESTKQVDVVYDFDLFSESNVFTDDTILTVATADAILHNSDFAKYYQKWFDLYRNSGWGGMFREKASKGDLKPYGSYGNGSAMRVSPCGWVCSSYEDTLKLAKKTAIVTHDHEEGIKGAMAVAGAIYLARNGYNKQNIIDKISEIGYDLQKPLEEFDKQFDATCQGTVPICMAIFKESNSFEECIRRAIVQGGDCDTNACIVGGIAEAFYGCPSVDMIENAFLRLDEEMLKIVIVFLKKYCYKRED